MDKESLKHEILMLKLDMSSRFDNNGRFIDQTIEMIVDNLESGSYKSAGQQLKKLLRDQFEITEKLIDILEKLVNFNDR